jgi:hypothetical protein
MEMRINNDMLDKLIENEGTVDGINIPNATGVLRLALDLKEARNKIKALERRAEEEVYCNDCGEMIDSEKAGCQNPHCGETPEQRRIRELEEDTARASLPHNTFGD